MVSVSSLQCFQKAFGEPAVRGLRDVFKHKACTTAFNANKLQHFLSLGEMSPQVAPCKPRPETEKDDILDFLAKMALHAPEVWFSVITGLECPPEAKNDWANIGVAFDASSRLRRAGIEYYHALLAESQRAGETGGLPLCYFERLAADARVDSTTKQVLSRPKSFHVRVVAVSDTHLLHDSLEIPDGDLLVHAGDLSYEESRSKDARDVDSKWDEFNGDFSRFLEWFKSSELDAARALRWLGTVSEFEHRVLVGGNHDYVLERIGDANAIELCQNFNLHYLCTTAEPEELRFRSGCRLAVWGSGVSATSKLGQGRAVLSGNMAFQLDKDSGETEFREMTAKLPAGSVDVMITHGPPCGVLYGASGKTFPSCINDLISRVRPKLFICGHAHNPDNMKAGQKAVDLGEGVLGINAACTGTWNQLSGMPFVVDLPVPYRDKVTQSAGRPPWRETLCSAEVCKVS
ncbi:rglC [Symbiodinium sp. CCMP2592]|nr:rglC [Symbiodinium sp. CCMP2592]